MKKIISFVMAAAVLAAVLCGCSSNTNDSADNESSFRVSYTYDSHYSGVNESVVRAYNMLCEAVINGEDSVLFNTSLLSDLNRLYYTSFPLSYLVSSININSDNTGLNISYINDSETHLRLVKEFNEKVDEIMKSCGYGRAGKSEYILNVYTYLSSSVKYDNIYTTAYDAIINGVGSSSSISSAFEYLLLQGGIDVSHIYGMGERGLEFLSVAAINGEQYMFNPGRECLETGGLGLSCFGLSYSDLIDSGYKNGFTYTDEEPVVFEDTSEKFSPLRDTVSYEFDGGVINAVKSNGDKVNVSL